MAHERSWAFVPAGPPHGSCPFALAIAGGEPHEAGEKASEATNRILVFIGGAPVDAIEDGLLLAYAAGLQQLSFRQYCHLLAQRCDLTFAQRLVFGQCTFLIAPLGQPAGSVRIRAQMDAHHDVRRRTIPRQCPFAGDRWSGLERPTQRRVLSLIPGAQPKRNRTMPDPT